MAYRSGSRPGLFIPLTSTVGLMTAFGRATGTILGSCRLSQEQMVGRHELCGPIPASSRKDFGSALLEVLYALKAVEVDDRVRH